MHSELRRSAAMQSEQMWQPSPALGLPRTVAAIKDGLSSFHPNGPPALSCWQNKLLYVLQPRPGCFHARSIIIWP